MPGLPGVGSQMMDRGYREGTEKAGRGGLAFLECLSYSILYPPCQGNSGAEEHGPVIPSKRPLFMDILERLDHTQYGDKTLRLLMEAAAAEIQLLRQQNAELTRAGRDDREAFIRMGEVLKSGGMTDPWFLLGAVTAMTLRKEE